MPPHTRPGFGGHHRTGRFFHVAAGRRAGGRRLRRRRRDRRRRERLPGVVVQDGLEFVALQRLLLHEPRGQQVQRLAVLGQDRPGAVPRPIDQLPHLLVDLLRDALRVVALLAQIAAQEDQRVLLAEGPRPQFLAHPPLRDHVARDRCRLRQVVVRARRHLPEDQRLGRVTTQRRCQEALVVGPARQPVLVLREVAGVSARHAARHDRHLVHRVVPHDPGRDQGVPALVIGDDFLLLAGQEPAPALRTRHHPIHGLFELRGADALLLPARRQDGRLVEQVGEVGAREPGRLLRDGVQLDARGQWLAGRVHRQDGLAALDVRRIQHHLPVEAAGAQQRGVENVGPVGGRDHDDVRIRVRSRPSPPGSGSASARARRDCRPDRPRAGGRPRRPHR